MMMGGKKMISSGIVMNWSVWGLIASILGFYFMMVAGHRRDKKDRK